MAKSKLVEGFVPAGHVCPFSEECLLECPVNGKTQDKRFSCALARGLDMCGDIEMSNCEKPKLRKFRERNDG